MSLDDWQKSVTCWRIIPLLQILEKVLFCAGFQAMSTFLVMRELMLQLSRLFSLPITGMKLPGCDLIPGVSNYCLREWQEIWSICVNNKLYAIYQTVGTVVRNKGLSRHESVIINRHWIGYARLTHSYLLSGDDQPTCSTCGHPLTVPHILLDCVDLQDVQQRHYSVTCLRDLFETVDNRVVIDFIKDIRFYSLL